MLALRWRQRIDSLVKDTRLDARGFMFEATSLLIDAIADSVPDSRDDYRAWLVRQGRALIAAGRHPAGLFRLVNGMLWAAHDALSGQGMRMLALQFLQAYHEHSADRLEQVAQAAAPVLSSYRALMTLSRDLTVQRTLLVMGEQDLARPVFLGEGRPQLEGTMMATELAWAGLDVTLGVDVALFGWLSEVGALVLGAESLSRRGLLARLGTATLARAVVQEEKPVYVLCSEHDFMPAEFLIGRALAGGSPDEILPDAHERITVRNPYWDLTPLDLITAVITERGPLAGDELAQSLQSVQVYPGLVAR
jgi:translation initiation factor eIF-2B subunit delta